MAIPRTERIRMMRSKGMSEKDAVMASMKRAPEKKSKKSKDGGTLSAPSNSREDYPYGLRIELDHEGMKKLGMHKMPTVGEKHHIVAHAKVTSSSEHSYDGEPKRRSVSMQITHMKMHKGKGKSDDSGNPGEES